MVTYIVKINVLLFVNDNVVIFSSIHFGGNREGREERVRHVCLLGSVLLEPVK